MTMSRALSPKRFTTPTGLAVYGFRYYSAELGRWLSKDPIGINGGINLNGMCFNDPVNYWDLLGEDIYFVIYYDNPQSDANGSFKRAAETWVTDVLTSKDFDLGCDRIIKKGVRTKIDMLAAWKDINKAIKKQKEITPDHYKAKKGAIFSHGGFEKLFFAGSDGQGRAIANESDRVLPNGEIESLPTLEWESDGAMEVNACNWALGQGGKAVIDAFAAGQGVPVTGQNGFADFSESPENFYQIDKDGAGSSIVVYLKAFKKSSKKHPNVGPLEGALRRAGQAGRQGGNPNEPAITPRTAQP